MSITEDVQRGRRDGLIALRDKLASAIEVAEPSVVAQLAGQLRSTLKELDELPDGKGKSARERFSERVAAAERPASSA